MTTPSESILVDWVVIVDLATSGVSRSIDNAGRISFRSHRASKKNERATLVTFEPAGGSYRVSLPGDAPLDVIAGFVRAVESPAGDRRKELNLWITSWVTLAANAIVARAGPRTAGRKRHRSTSIHALSGGLPTLGKRR
jgi:hypothetical protein